MATLVLTTIGTIFGGPIGGAIGALAGQVFDQAVLLKPKGGVGPRVQDLHVQTSTYGTQVPAIYGTMRVAGTVIWATDLQEAVSRSGGSKKRPSVTTYSYSASFAVALSSRRILSVGRIWADGKLLRGAGGDFKSGVGAFRLYSGDEDQGQDPRIAASEGMDRAPACRGVAYAMFEDLQLEDFGNRIPSLTFEVIADSGAVTMAEIVGGLTGGRVTAEGSQALGGYAASGETMRAALEPLVRGLGLRPSVAAGVLHLRDGLAVSGAVQGRLVRINGRAVSPPEQSRVPAEAVPVRMTLRHYDPARDYQAGVQAAARPGPGTGEAELELPATLGAGEARAIVERRLLASWKGRSRLEMVSGWAALAHAPGDVVTVAGHGGRWAVKSREWEGMGVRMMLQRLEGGSLPASLPATSGAAVTGTDLLHGPTALMAVELPGLGDTPAVAPQLYAAAAGDVAGWRKAALFTVDPLDGGLIPAGRTAAPAVMGAVVVPPGAGQPWRIDAAGSLEVELLHDGMVLIDADDGQLLRGANLCLVERELLQFGMAEPLGDRRWRLSRLVRGRRGSEWAMGGHAAGEPFLLIEEDCLAPIPGEAVPAIGGMLRLAAIGLGDLVPAEAEIAVTGEAVRPPSPVGLRVGSDGAGGIALAWTRRSRAGWSWPDGIDAPIGEEQELYRVRLIQGDAVVRQVESGVPNWIYDAAAIAADGTAGETVAVEIRQVGTQAESRALAGEILI